MFKGCKNLKKRIIEFALENEPAMLADVMEASLPLIQVIFILALCGSIFDAYFKIPTINASGLYWAQDIQCMGILYSLIGFCPWICFIAGALWLYVKSNIAQGQ